VSYLRSTVGGPFVEFGGRGGLDVQKQSCSMGREREEQIPLHPQRHQICFLATMQTCTVSSMRTSVSSFIHHRSGGEVLKIIPWTIYSRYHYTLHRPHHWNVASNGLADQ
jgi:hypothetical protein